MKEHKMEIASSSFYPHQDIPPKHTCEGENINPYLKAYGIPENTQSLALIMDDLTSGFVHWVVFNIMPTGNSFEILEDETPAGTQGKNDFGHNYYGGPCPQEGKHEYSFRVYALDKVLDLDESDSRKEVESEIEEHVLDTAEITGKYEKRN